VTPEVGGRIDYGAEDHEQTMLALGFQSSREIARTRIRVRTAMATQTREQGRYLGGRPPYGYRLADAGPHPNKVHASWGRRAHRLEPDPDGRAANAGVFFPSLTARRRSRAPAASATSSRLGQLASSGGLTSRRRIFPVGPFGSSSTSQICRGYL
jgi:site-specific DNA recombinase